LITFTSFIITPSYALISMDHHPRLMPVALPEAKGKDYFVQLISAVDFLHAHQITHNDIKPANILLSADDAPVLCDFGFAQLYAEPAAGARAFFSSLSWGTPEYLSPERAKGVAHDERLSDIWALGVTMYEIVVGRTPFERTEQEEFLTRDTLEVYYHRTTEGIFCGEYLISTELESLIHSMVDPDITTRCFPCGRALGHAFFHPPPSRRRPVPQLDPAKVSTPPRPRKESMPQETPQSAARRAAATASATASTSAHSSPRRARANTSPKAAAGSPVKVHRDRYPSVPTVPRMPAAAARGFSPRPLVLAERGVNRPFTPTRALSRPETPAASGSAKPGQAAKPASPPSRIPVRKADAAVPAVGARRLQETPSFGASPRTGAHKRTISTAAKKDAEFTPPARRTSPPPPVPAFLARSTKAKGPSPPRAPPPRVPSKSSLRQTKSPPHRETPPKVPPVPASSRVLGGRTQARASARQEQEQDHDRTTEHDEEEVLADRHSKLIAAEKDRASPSWSRSPSPASSSSSGIETSFLESSFGKKVFAGRNKDQQADRRASQSPSPQPDLAGRTSPLPSKKGSKFKLKNLAIRRPDSVNSLRRAPSALSFHALRSTLSRRRASAGPNWALEPDSSSHDDRVAVTLDHSKSIPSPLKCKKTSAEKAAERDKLAAFSLQIQQIIDARKESEVPYPAPPRSPTPLDESLVEAPILSPGQVRAFRAQVGKELEERRLKDLDRQESHRPRVYRSNSVAAFNKTGTSSPVRNAEGKRSTAVRMRLSATPSFVERSESSASDYGWVANSSTTSLAFSPMTSTGFKPGHKRVPTAIRNVPSIYLTSDADDDGDTDQSGWRSDTPSSDRVASPPPTPTTSIVQEGQQLPMWVPASDSDSDGGTEEDTTQQALQQPQDDDTESDEDADVDEPTVTLSTPIKARTPHSRSPGKPSPLRLRPALPTVISAPTTTHEVTIAEDSVEPLRYSHSPTPPLHSAFSTWSTAKSTSSAYERSATSPFPSRSESRATTCSTNTTRTQRVNFGDGDGDGDSPADERDRRGAASWAHRRQRSSRSLFSLFSNGSQSSLGRMSVASRASGNGSGVSIGNLELEEDAVGMEGRGNEGKRQKQREPGKEGRLAKVWKRLLK